MLVIAALRRVGTDVAGVLQCEVSTRASMLSTLPEGDEPVLVVGERRDEAAVRGQVAVLTGRDEHRPIAVRVLPHGPLALLALGAAAAGWTHLDAGEAVACFDAAAEQTLSVAWTNSVGGLDDPSPSLGQHLRSWAPAGAGFLVVHHPQQVVVPTPRGGLPVTWPDGVRAERGPLLVAGVSPPRGAVESAMTAAGVATSQVVDAVVDVKERYGSAKAVEMASVPRDPAALLAGRVDDTRCPVCTLAAPTGMCAFCKRSARPIELGGTE